MWFVLIRMCMDFVYVVDKIYFVGFLIVFLLGWVILFLELIILV